MLMFAFMLSIFSPVAAPSPPLAVGSILSIFSMRRHSGIVGQYVVGGAGPPSNAHAVIASEAGRK